MAAMKGILKQWRFFLFFVIPLAFSWIPIVWPTPSAKAGYILLMISMFLVTEVVPIPAIVLFSLFLMAATGLQSTVESAKHFGSDILFLFLSVLILAISIEETNLHSRLALLTIRLIGVSPARLILGFLLISGFLSMWMSNAAVTLMIIPIANAVSESLSGDEGVASERQARKQLKKVEEQLDTEELFTEGLLEAPSRAGSDTTADSETTTVDVNEKEPKIQRKNEEDLRLCKALQLCIAFGANIGGLATLIGAYPNMLFKNILEKMYGPETGITFFTFLMVCAPMAVCSLILTWVVLSAMFIPGWLYFWRSKPKISHKSRMAFIRRKLEELGPMRHSEITVVIIFLTVITLWLSRDPKFVPGWGTLVRPGFGTDSFPALVAATLFFVLPSDYRRFAKGEFCPILEWKKVVSKFPWELIIYVGGLTTMTDLANTSGLINSIGNSFPDLSSIPPVILTTLVCIFCCCLTEVMSNSIITSIFVPVLANIAENMRINPIYLTLTATVSSQLAFCVPIGSFPTIVVYGFRVVTMKDMFRAGLAPKIVCLVFLICSLELLGWLVLDVKTFPHWAEKRLLARTAALNITNKI